jgi:hypothetical protein
MGFANFYFYADKMLGIINYALSLYNSYVEWYGFSFVYAKVVAELLLSCTFFGYFISLWYNSVPSMQNAYV